MSHSFPEDSEFFLITRASLSITSLFKKVLGQNALSEVKPSYFGALMCLWANEAMDEMLGKFGTEDGMKLTELGRCAGVEPSTITGLVDRMEKDGLVYRSSVPGDRRAHQANLTDKGRQIREQVLAAVDEMKAQAFAGVDPADLKIAKKVLGQILENTSRKNLKS